MFASLPRPQRVKAHRGDFVAAEHTGDGLLLFLRSRWLKSARIKIEREIRDAIPKVRFLLPGPVVGRKARHRIA